MYFPPNCQPTHPLAPNSLWALAGGAGPSGCAAASCSGWAGSAESGRSGGAECAGLREAEAEAGAGPRSPQPGRATGTAGKSASCSARTAVSPAAPPAAPLTFHLQEKLPSGRRRRFPVPGIRTRWARLLAACGKGRRSPRVAASRGLISLTESRVYTGRME